jgi:hypothetical protein
MSRIYSDDDARMYMNGCFFMFNGIPVRVLEPTARKTLVKGLIDDEERRVKNNDLEPFFTPGNIMVEGRYVFVSRAPKRQAKFSLSQSGMEFHRMPWEGISDVCSHHKEIGLSMSNIYPSFHEAVSKVFSGENVSMPFHREWGIGLVEDTPHLIMKDTPVGVALEDRVCLFNSKYWLKERLLEVLNELE